MSADFVSLATMSSALIAIYGKLLTVNVFVAPAAPTDTFALNEIENVASLLIAVALIAVASESSLSNLYVFSPSPVTSSAV